MGLALMLADSAASQAESVACFLVPLVLTGRSSRRCYVIGIGCAASAADTVSIAVAQSIHFVSSVSVIALAAGISSITTILAVRCSHNCIIAVLTGRSYVVGIGCTAGAADTIHKCMARSRNHDGRCLAAFTAQNLLSILGAGRFCGSQNCRKIAGMGRLIGIVQSASFNLSGKDDIGRHQADDHQNRHCKAQESL